MRGDHHDLVHLQVEEFGSRLVDLGVRLVVPRQLCSEDAVPRQAAELRKVRHQRDVAVRERRDDESLLQSRQALHRIGPRMQPMPRVVERADLVLGKPFHPEVDEDLVEDHPMKHVELGPRAAHRSARDSCSDRSRHARHRRTSRRRPSAPSSWRAAPLRARPTSANRPPCRTCQRRVPSQP